MEKDYTVVRSDRKTLSIQVKPDGTLLVRAPRRTSAEEIEHIVEKHRTWIEKTRVKVKERSEACPEPTEEEKKALIVLAKAELPPLIERYAALMGVEPTGLTVTSARTRWGSCSGKNSLSFSWRLMLRPKKAVEAVVVHELAHIRHKDHGKDFYAEVLRILPDYYERIRLLK